jgi:PAS domain S-box-containing protein
MSQSEQLWELNDLHAAWISMWQEAVGASRPAIGLTELSTARFIHLSPRAASLLGTTVEGGAGLSYLDFVDPPRPAAEAFRLAREGVLEGTQTRRRLRRTDGSVFEARTTGWAIRSPAGPDLGLWLAYELDSADHAIVPLDVVAPALRREARSTFHGDRFTIDSSWRPTDIVSSTDSLFGRSVDELLDVSLLTLIHPDDLPVVLFALARATTDANATAYARIRHRDGSWRVVRVVPEILEGEAPGLVTFVLAGEPDPEESSPGDQIDQVPCYLRRIADQIEAAGVIAPLAQVADTLGITGASNLSPRQWEILSRLVRGQRVAQIAAEVYLSRSTVRNHLSAIYAKVGVHSQEELVARYYNNAYRREGQG